MSNKQDLIEKRAKIVMDAQELASRENFTSDDDVQFNRMMDEATALARQVDALDRAGEAVRALDRMEKMKTGREDIDPQDSSPQHNKAYKGALDRYVRFGIAALDHEDKAALQTGFIRPQGAGSTTTTTAGGFTVPEGFNSSYEKAQTLYNSVEAAGASILETDTGNDIVWPTVNESAVKGRFVAQNATGTVTDMVFGAVTFKAYTASSDIILLSNELLQDTGVNLEDLIGGIAGERIGRLCNGEFTKGTGATGPTGMLTTMTSVAAATATAISFDDLTKLKYSVSAAYRDVGKFAMHTDVLREVAKLKDGENRPLFLPSVREDEMDLILGRDVIENTDMDNTIAATKKSVVFGDFSRYRIRKVRGLGIRRLDERYAENNQTAFVMFQRVDGALVDAGAGSMKALLH